VELKQHVGKLIEQVKAMSKIRARLGVDRMTDAQLIELADELRAASFSPAAIQILTDLTLKEGHDAKDSS
jgi:hypothetical protein